MHERSCARTPVCADRAACRGGCSLSPQPHRTWYPSLGPQCIRSSWRAMWKVSPARCWSGQGEVTRLCGGRSVWPKGGGKVRTAHRQQCLGDQEAPEMRLQPRNWGLPGPSASHIRVPAHGGSTNLQLIGHCHTLPCLGSDRRASVRRTRQRLRRSLWPWGGGRCACGMAEPPPKESGE